MHQLPSGQSWSESFASIINTRLTSLQKRREYKTNIRIAKQKLVERNNILEATNQSLQAEIEILRASRDPGNVSSMLYSTTDRSIWSGRGAHESHEEFSSEESSVSDFGSPAAAREDPRETSPGTASEPSESEATKDQACSSNLTAEPSFFVCMHCNTPRSSQLNFDGICAYCMEPYKYCAEGRHQEVISSFRGADGTEHDTCKECRSQTDEDTQEMPKSESSAEESKTKMLQPDMRIKKEQVDDLDMSGVRTSDARLRDRRAFTGWAWKGGQGHEVIVIDE